MGSEEIYSLGYEIPVYGITHEKHWQYREEVITLPYGAVYAWYLPEMPFKVARIEDIRNLNGTS